MILTYLLKHINTPPYVVHHVSSSPKPRPSKTEDQRRAERVPYIAWLNGSGVCVNALMDGSPERAWPPARVRDTGAPGQRMSGAASSGLLRK